MSKPIVLVTSSYVAEEAQSLLRGAGAEVELMPGTIDERRLLSEFSRRPVAAVLMRGPAPFTPAVFDAAKDLKVISKHGAGYDSIDLDSATKHGVALMVTSGANSDAVAEHALALMLALTRELPRFDSGLRKGAWKVPGYLIRSFRESTVGVVGYGQIGQRTARLAQACGARVIIHSRTCAKLPQGMAWEDSLERLLPRVDILSLHTPLTGQTRGMIGEKQFALMKPGSYFVNTSRGKLVDELALIAALSSGHLAGAGLDVYAKEPPDASNPLLSMTNVICTPHISAGTTDAASKMGIIAAHNIVSYLHGEIYDPVNFINPAVLRK